MILPSFRHFFFVFFGFGVEQDLVGGAIFVCIGCFGAGLGICLGTCLGFDVCFVLAKCLDVGCGFGRYLGHGRDMGPYLVRVV